MVSTSAQLQCEIANHLRTNTTAILCDDSVYGLSMMNNEDIEHYYDNEVKYSEHSDLLERSGSGQHVD